MPSRPDVTIAMAQGIWDEIRAEVAREEESAGVLLAGVAESEDRLTFTINRVCWVPEDQYDERLSDRLIISSGGWMPALKLAADGDWHPIFFHTHPSMSPSPSPRDDRVDAALAHPFQVRAQVSRYASLIIGGDSASPSFTGRVYADSACYPVARLRVVGSRLRLMSAADCREAAEGEYELHDRQVRAFGKEGQAVVRRLRVGVVGAGGTGSSVAEQLIRLGAQDLVVIDDDAITKTNVSRVYGSGLADVDRPKVNVVKANAERIGLTTNVKPHQDRVSREQALRLLRHCDIVFGCTDDHTGRFNLTRLAYWYLVPLIDMGIQISAAQGVIRGIIGRVTYVAPGEACLVCRNVVDLDRVRDEGLDPAEREQRAAEGYAQGLDEPDPSVVAYTTMVAAWAVSDLLERLFGFGDDAAASEFVIRIADRKMKGRHREPTDGHFCTDPTILGLGDRSDFLGQRVWP